ncbi:MAG: alanyl-tRNA editing protein [Firmicutes bacterium]|nr:alanyl-tRNA editing protein [Bacillota bacterium]
MTTTKLYQTDTYLKEWDACILAAETASDGRYLIQLDRTAFFPEGGGQGADHGVIRVILPDAQDAAFSVIDVQEDGDAIIHTIEFLDPSAKAAAGDAGAPVAAKCLTEGCKVRCTLDWDRRFEHMQRHCGEHILSGAFYSLFGGANHGFHMGQDYMTIDIALEDGSPVTPEMARQAELLANQVIWDDLPVSVSYFDTREEAEQLPLRKALAFDEAISIVTIGDLSDPAPADCVACCGTHPATTGQIGLIKIYKVEKYKDMTRIYCDAGRKALADYQQKHDILTDVANRYSSSPEEFPEKLRIQEEKTAAIRNELHHLKKAYIEAESEKLDEVLAAMGDTVEEVTGGRKAEMKSTERTKAGTESTMAGSPATESLAPKQLVNNPGSKTPVILYPLEHLSMDDAFTMAKPYMGQVRAGQAHPLLLLYIPKQTSCVLVSDGTVHCGKLVKEYASFYQGKGGGNDVSARAIFTSEEDVRLFADLLGKHLQ